MFYTDYSKIKIFALFTNLHKPSFVSKFFDVFMVYYQEKSSFMSINDKGCNIWFD